VLEKAIPTALGIAFLNSGQACAAGTRLLVPKSRLDAVKRAIVDAMPAFPVGDPADRKTAVGPMVTEKQLVSFSIRSGTAKRSLEDGPRFEKGFDPECAKFAAYA